MASLELDYSDIIG